MEMTFRWYGESDPVTLEKIRQIPGVTGIVTAIYDVPVGETWDVDRIRRLRETVERSGLRLSVIESVPVHEDIKLGLPSRDRYIANYCETLRNLASEGIDCVCYNFMPVFDWTRSDLAHAMPDGSNALSYDERTVQSMNPATGDLTLPGWDASYTHDELTSLLERYQSVSEEDLWDHLGYFLDRVIKVAEEVHVKMAIHPDDPMEHFRVAAYHHEPEKSGTVPQTVRQPLQRADALLRVAWSRSGERHCRVDLRVPGARPFRARPQRADHGRAVV